MPGVSASLAWRAPDASHAVEPFDGREIAIDTMPRVWANVQSVGAEQSWPVHCSKNAAYAGCIPWCTAGRQPFCGGHRRGESERQLL